MGRGVRWRQWVDSPEGARDGNVRRQKGRERDSKRNLTKHLKTQVSEENVNKTSDPCSLCYNATSTLVCYACEEKVVTAALTMAPFVRTEGGQSRENRR